MSTLDIRNDAPGLLRIESLNITLKFERLSSTTGRVSWNIPSPATGCDATTQAYNGIVITLDTTPTASNKLPVNGTSYISDPTASSSLFSGDKIGTSLVIGAFYDDKTSNTLDVLDLLPNTPYYISGFPVDAQLRYFRDGIHSYSLNYTNNGTDDTKGSQVVVLNSTQPTMGVDLTDNTGLQLSTIYEFKIQLGVLPRPQGVVDSVDCNPTPPTVTISIDGTNAQTFQDLIAEINKKLSLLENPFQGVTPPNTGILFWNTTTSALYQWDGSLLVALPVIVQSTVPNTVIIGTYWLNPTTNVLQIWTGAVWSSVTVLSSTVDPQLPIAEQSYWFDGAQSYLWNGNTWCDVTTFIQSLDPSLPTDINQGSYWYNPTTNTLYKWDNVLDSWVVSSVIRYSEDPNTLSTGAYWYNEDNNSLYAWNTPNPGWNIQINVSITEQQPTTPAPGKFWYNPITKVLQQWNGTSWVILSVISYPNNPTVRSFCDVWWNTTLDVLNVWDGINTTWVQVSNFYNQTVDPILPPTLNERDTWYDTDTNILYYWNNNCFVPALFINSTLNPVDSLVVGTVWFNPTTSDWFVLDGTMMWQPFIPVTSTNDPTMLPAGTFWFNTSNNTLQQWNGLAWIALLYQTTSPSPTIGTKWFDTTINTLKEWTGTGWILSTPLAVVELDCNGNLLFTHNTPGSLSFILLTEVSLFSALSVSYTFHDPKPGTDGVSDKPLYEEPGIGTDNSADQRLQLMTEIRYELGYPVVDVEVTNEQLDYAITKALSELRQKSGLAYKRGFFFMQVTPETQRYLLTNRTSKMNTIVEVLGIQRLTSSFLSSAHGAGIYGQILLSHLYNQGAYDLLSHHIMTEYTKTMEILFAARITYTFNEQTRELWIHHRFPLAEKMVAVEAVVERSEQDIISDRYSRPWVRRYAIAVTMLMLANTRGKYGNLPGASGSVTLNAGELRQAAKEEIEACLLEIDNYIADRPEEYGLGTTILFG